MEIPIQVAVRVRLPPSAPHSNNNNAIVVKSIPGTVAFPLPPPPPAQPPTTVSSRPSSPRPAAADNGNSPMGTPGIVQLTVPPAPPASFPFSYALPEDCAQDQLYMQCVYPMLGMYLEGFDASFVTYGQRGTGKTYTMLGPAGDIVRGGGGGGSATSTEEGIVQRCVRDLFGLLELHRERNYVLNIGWVEVLDDEIHDLLDNSGNVPCTSVVDVFHWLNIGLGNRAAVATAADGVAEPSAVHSIFTLTLEQHWVADGLIQHRLSTASFCDLAGTCRQDVRQRNEAGVETDKVLAAGVPEDAGLQVLDEIVDDLAVLPGEFASERDPPYTRTTLTTLLKDSFGGRAQTLLILCVSALAADAAETLHNLRFAYRAQCVRNFVVLNAFSDNNTPLVQALAAAAAAATAAAGTNGAGGGALHMQPPPLPPGCDYAGDMLTAAGRGLELHGPGGNPFGLQNQWLKLVANAEGLFSRLIASKSLGEKERERIEEWMFLKQECQDCLSSGDMQMMDADDGDPRHLGPIQEETSDPGDGVDDDDDDDDDDEDEEDQSDDDNDDDDVEESVSCQQNTDSDSESQQLEYLHDRMAQLMDEFRTKTDTMVDDKYTEFVGHKPDAVLGSLEQTNAIAVTTGDPEKVPLAESPATPPPLTEAVSSPQHRTTGRRKSIQPGGNLSLSSRDIARLNAVAGAKDTVGDPPSSAATRFAALDESSDAFLMLRSIGRDPIEKLDVELRKVRDNVLAAEQQAAELSGTVDTTQTLLQTLAKRAVAQNKIGYNKKRAKLEADCLKGQKVLNKAMAKCGPEGSAEVVRLRGVLATKRELYAEFVNLNSSEEVQIKCKQHQKVLKATKKKLEAVQKVLKKNRKREDELLAERAKLARAPPVAILPPIAADSAAGAAAAGGHNSASKSPPKPGRDVDARISHLDQKIKEKSLSLRAEAAGANNVLIRHEINQLRHTRDELVEQRCSIDQLRHHHRHKRLTPDEQRRLCECDESIEAIDAAIEYKNELISDRRRRSVDITASAQRERGGRMMMERLNSLGVEEMRVLLYKYFQKAIDFRDTSQQMEHDRDYWEAKARQLHNEVLRVRYESDRRAAMMHQQQEAKLAMYMRHINENALADSLSSTTTTATSCTTAAAPPPPPQSDHRMRPAIGGPTTTALAQHRQPTSSSSSQHRGRPHLFIDPTELDITAALPAKQEKQLSSSSKLFSKFQLLKTQYRAGGSGSATNKVHDSSLTLPEQQLRHLHGHALAAMSHVQVASGGSSSTATTPTAGTKVTREKKKLVIQQQSGGR